jgi:chemotaxis protein methyltransferase CheR
MTTNETSWFRDVQPFETLQQVVLPEMEKLRGSPLRIWSSACSSGQEPYTISMILSEYCRKTTASRLAASQIIATDISASMLRQAKQAQYENVALGRGLSDERRQQFFKREGESWRVVDEVRNRVSFREQNLLQGFSTLGKFDIIFCRNVLIYFSAERKQDILQRMALSLNRGGYLFLGASETISGYSDAYELVRTPFSTIYRRKD